MRKHIKINPLHPECSSKLDPSEVCSLFQAHPGPLHIFSAALVLFKNKINRL